MQRGYIKIWRKLEDSGLLQMPNTLALFMVMLFRAAYKPYKSGLIEIDRGQLIAGRFQLCEWTGLSEQNVRTSLKHLHDMKILTSKPTNKFTVYVIVNYGQYQDYDDAPNQQTNQQLTNNQPTTNQQLTTIKELNTLSIKELNIITPKRKTKTSLPCDFVPTQEHQDFAGLNKLSLSDELTGFRLHHESKLTTSGNWNSSFSTWLRNAVKWRKPEFISRDDRNKQIADQLTGRSQNVTTFLD